MLGCNTVRSCKNLRIFEITLLIEHRGNMHHEIVVHVYQI